jgi:hypothetical protein
MFSLFFFFFFLFFLTGLDGCREGVWTISRPATMPSPRMRAIFVPRACFGSPYPRFVACFPPSSSTSIARPPSFVAMTTIKPGTVFNDSSDELARAFARWRSRFRQAIEAVVDEDSERARRAMRCKRPQRSSPTKFSPGAEQVYKNAWLELHDIQEDILDVVRNKATRKQDALAITTRLQDAENQGR